MLSDAACAAVIDEASRSRTLASCRRPAARLFPCSLTIMSYTILRLYYSLIESFLVFFSFKPAVIKLIWMALKQ